LSALSCIPCLFRFCALGALFELDNLRAGQFMLARPIVLGPLLGWFLGNAGQGALLGAAVEILNIESLPLGELVPLNGTVAVCAAVWVGQNADAPGFGLAGGLILGWLFAWAETFLRAAYSRFNAAFEEAWRRGRAVPAGAVLASAAAAHWAWCYLTLLFGVRGLEWIAVTLRPWRAMEGFETALAIVPVLGFAAFLSALRPRA